MFVDKIITKKQVQGIVDYCHRTLFSHLQLYLSCLKSKQPRRDKPIQILASVPQRAAACGLDTEQCVELKDEED